MKWLPAIMKMLEKESLIAAYGALEIVSLHVFTLRLLPEIPSGGSSRYSICQFLQEFHQEIFSGVPAGDSSRKSFSGFFQVVLLKILRKFRLAIPLAILPENSWKNFLGIPFGDSCTENSSRNFICQLLSRNAIRELFQEFFPEFMLEIPQ